MRQTDRQNERITEWQTKRTITLLRQPRRSNSKNKYSNNINSKVMVLKITKRCYSISDNGWLSECCEISVCIWHWMSLLCVWNSILHRLLFSLTSLTAIVFFFVYAVCIEKWRAQTLRHKDLLTDDIGNAKHQDARRLDRQKAQLSQTGRATRPSQWCNFEWHWMKSSDLAKF